MFICLLGGGISCFGGLFFLAFFSRVYEVFPENGEMVAGEKVKEWVYYNKNKKGKHNLFLQKPHYRNGYISMT